MRKTLRQLYNHKVKYPGSLSYYTMNIRIGSNAVNKKKLRQKFTDMQAGLEKYLEDHSFMLEDAPPAGKEEQ